MAHFLRPQGILAAKSHGVTKTHSVAKDLVPKLVHTKADRDTAWKSRLKNQNRQNTVGNTELDKLALKVRPQLPPTAWKKFQNGKFDDPSTTIKLLSDFSEHLISSNRGKSAISYLSRVKNHVQILGANIPEKAYSLLIKRISKLLNKSGSVPAKAAPFRDCDIKCLPKAQARLATALIFTGFRVATSQGLDEKDIFEDGDTISITIESNDKTNYDRQISVRLPDRITRSELKKFLRLKKKDKASAIKSILDTINSKLRQGKKPLSKHSFRRTFALLCRSCWESRADNERLDFDSFIEKARLHAGWKRGSKSIFDYMLGFEQWQLYREFDTFPINHIFLKGK